MDESAIWEKLGRGKAECYVSTKFSPKLHSGPCVYQYLLIVMTTFTQAQAATNVKVDLVLF